MSGELAVVGWEKVVQNLSTWGADVVHKVQTAVEITQAAVAADAKTDHPKLPIGLAHSRGRFAAQTGQLEGHIQPGRIIITDTMVDGEVIANVPYAGFVESGTSRARAYPFMVPALHRNQKLFRERLTDALKSAKP